MEREMLKEALGEFKNEIIDEVKTYTREEVKKMIQEQKIGKVDAAPELDAETKKDVREFFKALVGRDYVALKALSEGTDSAGGYLVPEEFSAKVIDIAGQYGYVRRFGTVVPMRRDTLTIPKFSSKPAVQWVGEGGTIPAGQPSFDQVQLTAKKAALIVPVTTELFEDSGVDVANLLSKLFGEAVAKAEDEQGFTGNGTVFTGILHADGVNTVTMDAGETSFSDVSADDLINLIAAVPSSAADKGMFVMHRTILAKVKTLKDGNGSYLFDPKDRTIWGYPVITSDVMPALGDSAADTPFIIFGDLSYLYLGDRKKISVALADQATVGSDNLFEKDMLALRVIERVAIAVAMPEAFAILKTAAS